MSDENKEIAPKRIPAIEVNEENALNYVGADIVAIYVAAIGACGEHAGVKFVTRDGNVYHTNYARSISWEKLSLIFPPLRDQWEVFGGYKYVEEWCYKYLGLGNFLVVHHSIVKEFLIEVERLEKSYADAGVNVILYSIWIEAVLSVISKF